MDLEFSGEIWFWRGPSPFHFVTVPEEESMDIEAISGEVSYGWGCIPVAARIGVNAMEDVAVPQGWRLHRADQGCRPPRQRLALGDMVELRLTTPPP